LLVVDSKNESPEMEFGVPVDMSGIHPGMQGVKAGSEADNLRLCIPASTAAITTYY
jgi:hypothetical protein